MPATRNRSTERVPARLQVNYTYEGCYLISFSGDLSADGIYICTSSPAPVGTILTLVFPFPNRQEIAVTARVVWSEPDADTGQWGMGLQFIELPPMLRRIFLDIVDRIAILGSDLGASDEVFGTA